MPNERTVIDLGSQDLDIDFLNAFRRKLGELAHPAGGSGREELIMFTAGGRPYQFKDLDELSSSMGALPQDVGYFYYTLISGGLRASLYLDPDRPAKLVLEGAKEEMARLGGELRKAFPPSGPRDVLHGRLGPFIVWGSVLAVAMVFLAAVVLATGEARPLLVTWVIFISGMVGVYLSIARSRAFAMASTMSLGKKRRPYLELVLHFITVALGIISVIIVAMLL
ncbi:MAG: hypothetical protein MUC62_04510 [Candidatus Thermoplasmatota archaeon]|jgi:hypothetical protein|nr:hypothetical protein [Candidatus Thermoplasmatota archaeon]